MLLWQPVRISLEKAENIKVNINRENGALHVFQIHEVVEEVTDPVTQISKTEADASYQAGSMRLAQL